MREHPALDQGWENGVGKWVSLPDAWVIVQGGTGLLRPLCAQGVPERTEHWNQMKKEPVEEMGGLGGAAGRESIHQVKAFSQKSAVSVLRS